MCFHTQVKSKPKQIEEQFHLSFADGVPPYEMKEHINGFSHPLTPVIVKNALSVFEWGLVPHWAKDKSLQKSTLNARIETITERNSFKNYTNNRCLVVVNGFYEWKHIGNEKQKHFIQLKDNDIFTLAGIYSIWNDVPRFSIVTTEANELMAEIHNTKKRMPVVIPQVLHHDWLTNPDIKSFAKLDVDLEATNLDYQQTLFDE